MNMKMVFLIFANAWNLLILSVYNPSPVIGIHFNPLNFLLFVCEQCDNAGKILLIYMLGDTK